MNTCLILYREHPIERGDSQLWEFVSLENKDKIFTFNKHKDDYITLHFKVKNDKELEELLFKHNIYELYTESYDQNIKL